MNLEEILTGWRQSKTRFTHRRLDAPCTIEHKYDRSGAPSTYAFVRFECVPADDLVFEMRATWPAHLTTDYCQLLRNAMSAAIVDALVAADDAHTGCALTCVDVKWDDIRSSEMAFYRATQAAMTTLREREKWSFAPKAK